jgi:sugar phosphate isomerase/epimerase
MFKTPIALQLYSVRGECGKDLPGTLAAVAKLGYQGAEPWGYSGDKLEWQGHPVQAIRKMYDDNGLVCCGIHLQTQALLGDNLERTIEFNQTLGNRFLVIAGDKPRMSALNGILELATILNRAAEKLRPLGLFCGYHAHPFDFELVDGRIAWDILFSCTRQDVIMQMDIGNCMRGNGDPINTMRKFPGRARTVHLKDFGGPEGAVIGEGKADWAEVFYVLDTVQRPEWYVVEEGGKDGLSFDVCARSLAALHKFGR